MTRSPRLAICLVSLGLASAAGFADPPVYHLRTTGPELDALFPGNQYLNSRFRGMNEHGDAVGEVQLDGGMQECFIYTVEHGVTVLPRLPGHPSAQAMDVSDRDANGEVVIVGAGALSLYDTPISPVVWRFSTVTGQVLEARDVGNLAGFDEGKLTSVNNNGWAVGYQGETVYGTVIKYNIGAGVLEALDFPTRPADLNNADQIVGDRYVGDLEGAYSQMSIPPDSTSLFLTGINDRGWLVGRVGRPYSDGAGRFLASWVRHTDQGWHVPNPGSPWDSGFAINEAGDITIGFGPGWHGAIYDTGSGQTLLLAEQLDLEFNGFFDPDFAYAINDNLQVAATAGHAVLLTPLGRMIIPGDVNGDAEVNNDDHCAWMAGPIDLDGDGDADRDDEVWLIDRLAAFGFIYQDCNANGVNDHCDIAGGSSNDCNQNGVPDECEDDCDANGVPDACESDCNANGIPDPCDIANGTSDDCNANGIPDECDGADTVTGLVEYDPPQRLFADSTFTDTLLLTDVGTIADVDFTIHDNFRIGQTTVRLGHAGVTVMLIDRPGFPQHQFGFSNLGYDIVLDDEGSGPNIDTVGAPSGEFEHIVSPPSYKPDQPLSAFDGLPREGVWELTFLGGLPQHFDPKLFSWSVIVTDEAVDPGECCDADFDGDGSVNTIDVLAFLNAWSSGDPRGDFNGDGIINTIDVLAFLNAWSAGC